MRNEKDQFRRVSRRNFVQAGSLAAIVAPNLPAWSLRVASEHESSAEKQTDYLLAAKEAAKWIRSAEKTTDQGTFWLPEPDHPEKLTTNSPANTVYSGSAGTILFFLELAKVTGDPSYLQAAKSGADYVVSTWEELKAPQKTGLELSLNSGVAGVAFVLTEVWKATQEDKYKEAALTATWHIVASTKPAGIGVEWASAPGVAGDGGIILFLLYASKAFQDPSLRDLSARGGLRLLDLSQHDPRGGLKWQGIAPERFGQAKDSYWPNFEMGTAGVAFVLARLYEETGEKKFLDAAKQGALHIQSIATIKGNTALVHYREPDLQNLYYLGYCHGPAGTARLFYELYKVTNDPQYLDWTDRLARGVSESGIPEKLTPGFWNVVCQCCGTAGVSELFVGLWAATKRPEYLAFAQRVAELTISRETNLDDKGYRWYQAWTRIKPWEVTAETGYMIGAAGVGSSLIHVHLATEGRYEAILFPDNPFPKSHHA
jgi:rhamnogalacturonyl hydrolase YesR